MSKRTLEGINKLIQQNLLQTPFDPEMISLESKSFPYMRVEIPIPSTNLLSWLQVQNLFPKIYFETPNCKVQVAGIGEAVSLNCIPRFQGGLGKTSRATPRFFGGMDFFERNKSTWGNFPSCRYLLPLIEIEVKENRTYFCLNRVEEHLPLERLQSLNFKNKPLDPIKAPPFKRLDIPSYPLWRQIINESLHDINHQKLDKIVFARSSFFQFKAPFSPLEICKSLQGKSKAASLFAFQFSPHQAFVGASPESLYKRSHFEIETAAVAGTRRRGKTKEEDLSLQRELLEDQKEICEFNIVKKEIEKRLKPLCTTLSKQKSNQIIQTATLQHIYHLFKGNIKEGIDDQDLIRALHPTPAVGGHPKSIAIREIQKKEGFDRGWYGAPVGWISPQRAHLIVGIRSALIQGNELCLFAGTGIVSLSTPQKEWEELELKISQFLIWK